MPFIKIRDINCYYEIHGQGEPLLLIAGLASDSQSWQTILAELARHFQVIIFDNRGVGRTNYPQNSFTIDTLAEDAVALLDELGIERTHILGHSIGGYIAQEIAINHVSKADKLILASTAAFTSERNKFLFANLHQALQDGIPYELFLREFFCWLFSPEYFRHEKEVEAAVQYALEYPYPQPLDGFRRQVEAINDYSSLDRLDKIQAETLVVVGRKDLIISPKDTQVLLDKIPHVTSVYLENAAHSIHMEDHRGFTKCILDFL